MLKHLLQDSSFEILGTPMTRQPTEPLQVLLWHESNSNHKCMGIGCGSVGRAVTSDTRDPRFESRHWQNFINCTIEKTKIKKKRPSLKNPLITSEIGVNSAEFRAFLFEQLELSRGEMA